MFRFTEAQISEIRYLNNAGNYPEAYRKIVEFTSVNDQPIDGIDPASWQWFRAAAEINEGVGSVTSDFIRGYNVEQYRIRTGNTLSDAANSASSDAIARAVLDRISNQNHEEALDSYGRFPSIEEIAQQDAIEGIKSIYGSDFQKHIGAWSGNPLFISLGYGNSFKENILESGISAESRSSYDLFATYQGHIAAYESFVDNEENGTRLGRFFSAFLIQNEVESIIDSTHLKTEINTETKEFVRNIYGYEVLNLNNIIGNINNSVDRRYIANTGSYNSDVIELIDGLLETDHLVNAGTGDDIIFASEDGNDLIDGDQGNDEVWYTHLSDVRLEVKLETRENFDFTSQVYPWRIKVSKDDGLLEFTQTDTLFSVEHVRLSQQKDTVILTPDTIKDVNLVIDAGNRVPGSTDQGIDKDILDLEAFTDGVQLSSSGSLFSRDGTINLNPNLSLKNFEIIKYGSGNDFHSFFGGETEFHEISLGAGDDIVANARNGSTIRTGTGNDEVALGNNIIYADLRASDRASLVHKPGENGFQLTGGVRPAEAVGLDSQWVKDALDVRYAYNEFGQLVIRRPGDDGFTFINNSRNGPNTANPTAGIALGQLEGDAFSVLDSRVPRDWLEVTLATAEFIYRARNGVEYGEDPLVLDLDGDGIELTAISPLNPRFDLDGDNFAELTGWVDRDDGLLVYDRNGNGTIDNIDELFGSANISGFEELRALNSNGDNWFSALDANYDSVQVWQDLDQNGISSANELTTLADAGITRIALYGNTPAADANDTANGNTVVATTGFIINDVVHTIADVQLTASQHFTTYLGDNSISDTASALPTLKGFGVLPDLQVAMTQNAALQSVVEATLPTLNTTDIGTLRQLVIPILDAWRLPNETYTDNLGQSIGVSRGDVPVAIGFDADGRRIVHDYAYTRPDGGWRLASTPEFYDDNGIFIENPTLNDIIGKDSVHFNEGEWEILTGQEIAFLERYFGQPLPLTHLPENRITEIYTLGGLLDDMYQRLELTAIKLAVQGPLSAFFRDVTYDIELDEFVPTTDRQLAPTFEAILSAAPPDDVIGYLNQWQDILRSFIGVYDRQTDGAENTYSFITANLVAAYENLGGTDNLAPSFTAIAEAFSVPEGILIESSDSTVLGTEAEDIFYIDANNSGNTQTFSGGKAHDAYVLGENFGDVVIDDYEDPLEHVPDILRFAHLKESDVRFVRDGVDLVITQNVNPENRVTVKGQFDERYRQFRPDRGVGEITFADGIYLDSIDIVQRTPKPSLDNSVIRGTIGYTAFDGGAGFDTLIDPGNTDTYYFGRGDAHDLIYDGTHNVDHNNLDYLVFQDGITLDDLRIEQEVGSNTLHLYVQESADILSINNQFDISGTALFEDLGHNQVDFFAFTDGLYLYSDELLKIAQQDLNSVAHSLLDGTNSIDYLDGGAGNDYLEGKNYSDTYVFGKGYGFDQLLDFAVVGTSPDDVVLFTPDVAPEDVVITAIDNDTGYTDVIIGFNDDTSQLYLERQFFDLTDISPDATYVDFFQFQDDAQTRWTWQDVRNAYLNASGTLGYNRIDGSNVITGTGARDYLTGQVGADTYLYDLGGSADIIDDPYIVAGNTIQFGAGITTDTIQLSRGANKADLHITFGNNQDSLTIVGNFALGSNDTPDSIQGLQFADGMVWDSAAIRNALGGYTAFNDHIAGFNSDDVLTGGAGADYLDGYSGQDTYQFNIGDGHDVITDTSVHLSDVVDTLGFGAGITPETVLLRQDDNDLLIDIVGHDDWVTVRHQLDVDELTRSIERFTFQDGTVWSHQDVVNILNNTGNSNPIARDDSDLRQELNTDLIINGNDLLANDVDADNHRLGILSVGEAVNGTVTLMGDGNVIFTPLQDFNGAASFQYTINDGHGGYSEAATVNIAIQASVINGTDNDNELIGTDSAESIYGFAGNDQIEGRDGDDLIYGGLGVDIIFGQEGDDVLYAGDSDLGQNTLFGGTGQDILHGGQGVDKLYGNEDLDIIYGYGGNDLLQGGAGKDEIIGGPGADILIYRKGDNRDLLADSGNSDGDKVFLTSSIQVGTDAIIFEKRAGKPDLDIYINGTADHIRISSQFAGTENLIELFQFANAPDQPAPASSDDSILTSTYVNGIIQQHTYARVDLVNGIPLGGIDGDSGVQLTPITFEERNMLLGL